MLVTNLTLRYTHTEYELTLQETHQHPQFVMGDMLASNRSVNKALTRESVMNGNSQTRAMGHVVATAFIILW